MIRLKQTNIDVSTMWKDFDALLGYLTEDSSVLNAGLSVGQFSGWVINRSSEFTPGARQACEQILSDLPYTIVHDNNPSGIVTFTCKPEHVGDFLQWLGAGHIMEENDVYDIYLEWLMTGGQP